MHETRAYDAEGTELRPLTVTNPLGQTWTYRYDPAGRLIEQTDFDGRTLRFGYEPTVARQGRDPALRPSQAYVDLPGSTSSGKRRAWR
ncbi:hypothetical protein BB31_35160 [Amycolatopsis lurida NRRL 2430]|uniref:Uncharacterized protein n=1 Tax=Amycolatopsis lurida NRRL 2430 TaxID=1460371 RepID=A0A2P2FIW2_AMYLU|nr:hypothetical protein BB31_35160 [Amycolatopsis lurida NRRL 2430]